jgi:hypothetical protein
MLAVFAVSAVASSSASAQQFFVPCHKVIAANKGLGEWENNTCTVAGGTKEFTTKLLAGETETITDSSGISLLESEVGGVKVLIECDEDISSGTLEEAGKTKGTIKFIKCRFFEIKTGAKTLLNACTVKTPIEFEFRDKAIVGKGVGPEEEFFPTAANKKLFVSITLEGATCALKGTYEATTTEENKGIFCALPEGWVAKLFHEIVCTSTGDERLKFGTAKASYTSTDTARLTSGGLWYVE